MRLLKYRPDVAEDWETKLQVIDFCLGSMKSLNDFMNELREKWLPRYSGTLGYVDVVSHTLNGVDASTTLTKNVAAVTHRINGRTYARGWMLGYTTGNEAGSTIQRGAFISY